MTAHDNAGRRMRGLWDNAAGPAALPQTRAHRHGCSPVSRIAGSGLRQAHGGDSPMHIGFIQSDDMKK